MLCRVQKQVLGEFVELKGSFWCILSCFHEVLQRARVGKVETDLRYGYEGLDGSRPVLGELSSYRAASGRWVNEPGLV